MSTFNGEIVTDNLIQCIRAIQHERRTGNLIIRRGNRNAHEEGSISFVEGHIVETKLDRRTGSAAFNELCSWKNCQISFTSNNPQGRNNTVTSTPSSSLPQRPIPPPAQVETYKTGNIPLRHRADTISGPFQTDNTHSGTTSGPFQTGKTHSGTMPGPFQTGKTHSGTTSGPFQTGKTHPGTISSSFQARNMQAGKQGTPLSTSRLKARPCQMRQFNAALLALENMQFSRAHRQIFLLINNERTVEELIHLSARHQEEVLHIVSDLEQAALIRF